MMTKVIAPPSPEGFAAAYIIQFLQEAENKRSQLSPITRQMIEEDVVPWGFRHCMYAGVSPLMSRVARVLKDKEVLGHAPGSGWFFKDEETAAEIVQSGSTRMRRGFTMTTNALEDIDESELRPELSGELQALGELIDEFRDELNGR